ncbi:uroporphyrinogen-III C-methyltransferase [Clostridium estertheticum]|uniref:uroporphyrinogen-III C-methyltransferase n=1 Tax=Clostridium estertheticum TaxID=238834 RepID=UPI001CF30545|nr:uroporphyrinogen-III C-methyltransferase [Clostridium estertheticum]MCB2305047.1 uroporphyrinogen-III C-methyltransferase [Clostridium estertheticum]MCB2343683.1 uroporphyrinogen-III C-methyltransferase [Clostridium estertheticum]MCB2348602.1 uroporphyrinogen-III C-methyltransferase [Clostridium estertheticum]WAG47544.1 uroporphyrinogen-III C-methyltransferase [Clostridium estertheticum]
MGKVYLMGVGPGDEELITLKAIRMLSKCTAVMYDRLASTSILKYLKADCLIYYCGKEPGCHYKTQDEINDMLVTLAKEGNIVGRIKGGDPFVFGRGGEEALALLHENIEFEVIPGITSPIAVLNYAGIPITHRGIAQSFHVFTAMSAEKLEIDWKAVVSLGGTLVFMMGFKNLEKIAQSLIFNGKNKSTPCAVIMRGTTSKQKKVVGTLIDIIGKVQEAEISSPCIIVIGEVIQFNDQFNWYEKKPLFGKNICITRSKAQAKELREELIDLGAEVLEINAIEFKDTSNNLDKCKGRLTGYDFITLTSVNGVNYFFDYLRDIKFDVRKLKAKVAAIGPATAKAIENRGIIPDIVAEHFVAESLFDKMRGYVKEYDKVLVPRSKDARPYLVEALRNLGCIVEEVFTYETICGKLKSDNEIKDVDVIVFTSPSTVKNMINMVGIETIQSKKAIAIGPITAKALMNVEVNPTICDVYSVEGVINKLLEMK